MKFSIVTLGCKVNEYESQFYAGQLKDAGFEMSDDHADAIIINTCTVTNTAAAKSRKKIHKAKKENPDALICVVGCYAQQLDEKTKELLDADIYIGANHKDQVAKAIIESLEDPDRKEDLTEDVSRLDDFEAMPVSSFESRHRAYLKIEDGCNQFCSYCAIPYARGRERSLNFDQAIAQARQLASTGHLEIVLTGIHTGRYDSNGKDLADLLKALIENTPEDVKYRISSIEITEVSDRLIDLMKGTERILPHLHIPIQSGSNSVLKRMNRPYTVEEFKKRADEIRKALPDISISADVIAGFVGESEEEFEETVKNLEDIRFSFLHVFPYSKRDRTAAAAMPGHLSGKIIKKRAAALMDLSFRLRQQDMARFKESEVLIETKSSAGYTGYTAQYHPVLVLSSTPLQGRVQAELKKTSNGTYLAFVKGDRYETFQTV